MMNWEDQSEGKDEVLQSSLHWELGSGRSHATQTLWRCDALRAGQLYNRTVFGTREEADAFAAKMRNAEPDQMFNVEAIKANTVWN
ncbi:MAG: hypothetical protein PW792_09200 [Acidobacteriaceae bacterium]|nr:hypothetical protein [Acidobacteriaceae bacterium]